MSQNSTTTSTLKEAISLCQPISLGQPTLEEKQELCKLLKKAIKDTWDPCPLDIHAMQKEFEDSGYDDKILEKLQRDISFLCLGAQGLQTLTPSIRLLKGLRHLDLSCNQLDTLPKELIEIPELYTLHLQDNRFKKVPAVVVEMAKQHGFSSLKLNWNPELKEIPISLKKRCRIISLPHHYVPIED